MALECFLILVHKAERIRRRPDAGIDLTCVSSGTAKQNPHVSSGRRSLVRFPICSGPVLCVQETLAVSALPSPFQLNSAGLQLQLGALLQAPHKLATFNHSVFHHATIEV